MSSKRTEQRIRTRGRIEAAARACLHEQGWDAVTITAITRAAGVAHGTFYVHFESKEAVLEAMLRRFLDLLRHRLASVIGPLPASTLDLGKTIRGLAEVYLDTLAEDRALIECYAHGLGSLTPTDAIGSGFSPELVTISAGLLQALAAARGVPLPDHELIAHGLMAMWLRVALRMLQGAASRDAAIDVIEGLTVGSIDHLLAAGGAA